MGARPIAVWDPIRFGPLDGARNRYLLGGVVGGIAGYGNAVGVPLAKSRVTAKDLEPLIGVVTIKAWTVQIS